MERSTISDLILTNSMVLYGQPKWTFGKNTCNTYEVFVSQFKTPEGTVLPSWPILQVVEENEDYIIRTTAWGATTRHYKKYTTTPEHLGFKITTPEAWEEIKDRITPTDDRIPWDMLKKKVKGKP